MQSVRNCSKVSVMRDKFNNIIFRLLYVMVAFLFFFDHCLKTKAFKNNAGVILEP